MRDRIVRLVLVGLLWVSAGLAASGFVVKDIKINGLKRIPQSTVQDYLPIKLGDRVDQETITGAVRALYQTGFFSDVNVAHDGHQLQVDVVEREVIAQIQITGNKALPKDMLDEALKAQGLSVGRVLNEATLANMAQALLELYHQHSYYAATVVPKVKRTTRQRALVELKVEEGELAKVTSLEIKGNHVFDDKHLTEDLQMYPGGLWTFFSGRNKYSEQRLQQDINQIENFYLDRGYLDFRVMDKQSTFSSDKQSVDVVVTIEEGKPYTLTDFSLRGEMDFTDQQRAELLRALKAGQLFSRHKVLQTSQRIGDFLAEHGYAFSKVRALPKLDQAKHTVSLVIEIHPGLPTLVRQIHFHGNTRTADYVLRREMRQLEGGVFALDKVKLSRHRLSGLGYLKDIHYKITPVEGHPDQVDIDFTVTEASSTSATLQAGYSDHEGVLFGGSFDQRNFLGSGNNVSFNFERSQSSRVVSVKHVDPYFTSDGISRTLRMYYRESTPGRVNISTYTTNNYGMGVDFGFPISEQDTVSTGVGVERILLHDYAGASTQITNYIDQYGEEYDQFLVKLGWQHNSLDQARYPTEGLKHGVYSELGLPVGGQSLDYYTVSYELAWYYPLIGHDWVLNFDLHLGYGRGYGERGVQLPFFKNFHAGGVDSLRGYENNSLGPRDSNDRALGGNVMTVANLNLMLPSPFGEQMRPALFIDAGNIYSDRFAANELRYSAGFAMQWRTPIAPLVFSWGWPLKSYSSDRLQQFGFSISTNF